MATQRNVIMGAKGISKVIIDILSELTTTADWVIRPKKGGKTKVCPQPAAQRGTQNPPAAQALDVQPQQFATIQPWIR